MSYCDSNKKVLLKGILEMTGTLADCLPGFIDKTWLGYKAM